MTLETQTATAQQALRLDIAGANLMIAGTFEQWVPLVMEGLRDERAVQLLVDITSAPTTVEPTATGHDQPLLAFESHDIKRMPYGHRARGTLSYGDTSADAEVLLQAPPAHTPFALLTLQLPQGFETAWQAMEKRAEASAALGETEVRARGWLRPPSVAAA